jgi:hypothetical protein
LPQEWNYGTEGMGNASVGEGWVQGSERYRLGFDNDPQIRLFGQFVVRQD